MMQCIYLVLDATGTKGFDAAKLKPCIQTLPGVINWKEGAGSSRYSCALQRSDPQDMPVPIEVDNDMLSISVGAYCDEGLEAAIRIQRGYDQEVLAFSEESSPNMVRLSTIQSALELAKQLKLR